MNQKMSMKEMLQKSKARRANQELTSAKIETGRERDAANDPNVEAAKDQSEGHRHVTKGDAEVQPEAPVAKKKVADPERTAECQKRKQTAPRTCVREDCATPGTSG